MTNTFDYLVFMGRFQPFHRGHLEIVKKAMEVSRNLVMVLGSHNQSRSIRNPFNTEERIKIIRSALSEEVLERVIFLPVEDVLYNDEKWISLTRAKVNSAIHSRWQAGPYRIGLIGHEKDNTSYYLKLFPTWENVGVPNFKNLNSTDLRNMFFDNRLQLDSELFVNNRHMVTIRDILESHDLQSLRKEYNLIQEYKKSWEVAPYPVTFNTVDAVVVQSGHILLVKRKASPGMGLMALPGGFINQYETLKEAVIRELYEETRIDVPKAVLQGSIKKEQTFDAPHRSDRGRTITHAFLFDLKDDVKLPKIKGGDDAEKAFWIPLNEVKDFQYMLFEDHYHIIDRMIGL